jgi:hypothetical protein
MTLSVVAARRSRGAGRRSSSEAMTGVISPWQSDRVARTNSMTPKNPPTTARTVIVKTMTACDVDILMPPVIDDFR